MNFWKTDALDELLRYGQTFNARNKGETWHWRNNLFFISSGGPRLTERRDASSIAF